MPTETDVLTDIEGWRADLQDNPYWADKPTARGTVSVLLVALEDARRARPTTLDLDEQKAMSALLDAYNRIRGWGLQVNTGELEQAVHVIQGFIVQHMLQRVAPDQWADWFTGSGELEPNPVDQLIAEYRSGRGLAEIARNHGLNVETVRHWLAEWSRTEGVGALVR